MPSAIEQDAAPGAIDETSGLSAEKTTQIPCNHRQDVRVRLQYLKDDPIYDTEKPLQITPNFLDREKRTNVHLAPGPVETVQDVRGREDDFSLDRNGFRYVKSPTSFTQWSSQPEIGRQYLPELETLLRREVDGCDEIMFYDARIRQAGDEGLRVEGLSFNPFAKQVHTDNTETSVLAKIHDLTEMKAEYLLGGRARIINIWRPIKHPVYDCGLAIADGGKLRDDDVIECERRRHDTPEKHWDTMGVIKYREGFDWWYMSEQGPDEILLFKNYDSSTDIPARCCLHTAFDLPPDTIPLDAPTRESIEVRALIFTYPESGHRPSQSLDIQHPLAKSLEQNSLKRIDLEHSITDRLRDDIDEASEIKDAMLILRRKEIEKLRNAQTALISERDELEQQLVDLGDDYDAAQQMIEMQANHTKALEAQVAQLSQQLHQENHRCAASEESPLGNDERTILLQQLARARADADAWRDEAMKVGSKAVSTSWQGSVDEAVRREREKDSFIIQSLRQEIAELKAKAVKDDN